MVEVDGVGDVPIPDGTRPTQRRVGITPEDDRRPTGLGRGRRHAHIVIVEDRTVEAEALSARGQPQHPDRLRGPSEAFADGEPEHPELLFTPPQT